MKRTLLAILLASTATVWAQQQFPQQQPPQQADDEGYAPEHGVARISLVNGEVSVRRGDSDDLISAALNGPLVVDDRLATGQNSRAEIQFDWGNMIRLAPDTEVRMGELEDRRYLVQVAIGTTTFSVLRDSGADVEISTPTVSVRPVGQGSYRVTVFPDGTTEITVRSGRAEIFSPRGTETLNAGRTMQARGTPSDPEFMIIAAIQQDEWDRWNVDRDRVLENTSSYRYVSPDIVGAEELDAYGRWTTDPEYGNVWVPTVDPGWAPYRVGRWVDEPYYGWTWVSGDPWGWAPYHYGNWYQSSFGWAWYPGPYGGRHYWRPALVGFFGWGSGGGLSFGFGNVGWVPLHPRERFRPWYGRGYNNTSIVNVSVVNNYRNARFVNGRNGVTSIGANDFGRGRRIDTNNFVRASNNDLARTGSVQGRLPFNASPDGRRMSDRQVNRQSLPRVNDNTRFAQRNGRSNDTRGQGQGPGQGRQAQIIGQSPSQGGPVRGNNPGPSVIGGGNSNGNAGNWRRFEGNAPANNGGRIDRGGNNGNSGGFRRFEGNAPSDNAGQIDRGQRSGQRNGIVQAPAGQPDRGANNGNNGGFRRFEGNAPADNGGRIDRGGNNGNGGGFRRFEGGTSNPPAVIRGGGNNERYIPPQAGPAPQVRENFPRREPQMRENFPRQVAPQQQQQPIRISPPIVRERGPSPQVSRQESRPESPRGGFGTPRPQGPQGGGGGNGNGGGYRGGGESRGNGGGNRGGGRDRR